MSFEESSAALRSAWSDLPADLVFLRCVDSTNRLATDVARELARDEVEIRPTLFLAWEQSAGRGRQGRSWESQAGLGVYATLLLPVVDLTQARGLPLAVAAVLCERLDAWCAERCVVKWPNDILVAGRKIAGILVESAVGSDGSGWAAVGFGLNHGHRDEQLPVPGSTSLRLEARSLPSWASTTVEIVRPLVEALGALRSSGEVVERFRALSAHEAGDTLTCRVGDETVEGTFLRFDDDGALVLETTEGERTLHAGDLLV